MFHKDLDRDVGTLLELEDLWFTSPLDGSEGWHSKEPLEPNCSPESQWLYSQAPQGPTAVSGCETGPAPLGCTLVTNSLFMLIFPQFR